jgi:hypothetical protein
MEVATICFKDRDSGDEAMALVRVEGEITGLALSLRRNGDIEVFWQARIGTIDRGVAEGASGTAGRQAGGVNTRPKLWGRRMNLVGAWVVDETDALALERWGNVVLEFDESGGLSYTIRGDDKDEIIILRYQVEGSALITDQPSAPKVERTQFSFTPDGVLVLAFGGVPSRFVRTPTPPTRLKSSAVH